MLRWSVIFFVVAITAGVLGFTNIAAESVYIGKVLFLIFIVLFILSLVIPHFRKPSV